jgi:membrane protease YdiL (CAAX protease family)
METPPVKHTFWANIFLSPDERRLRAGWRLLTQTVGVVLLLICLAIVFVLPAMLLRANERGILLAETTAEFFAFTIAVFLARRFLDKRSFVSLGFRLEWRALVDIAAGIAITFVLMGLVYLTMNSLGWIKFNGFAWQSETPLAVLGNTLLILFTFLMVSWNEELLSRGYHLQTIASGTNAFWGVVLSSAIFGCLHLFNSNATWISAVGIFLAGLFLAFGYLRTGQLWLSIGLHIGWNFFEGPVFGFQVSGMNLYQITRTTVSGPTLWTGGAFGPEAGLAILPALVLGALLIYLYSKLRERTR